MYTNEKGSYSWDFSNRSLGFEIVCLLLCQMSDTPFQEEGAYFSSLLLGNRQTLVEYICMDVIVV